MKNGFEIKQYSIEIWFIEIQTGTYLYVKTVWLVQRFSVCCFYYFSVFMFCSDQWDVREMLACGWRARSNDTPCDIYWSNLTRVHTHSFHEHQSLPQKAGRYRIYQNSINHQRRQGPTCVPSSQMMISITQCTGHSWVGLERNLFEEARETVERVTISQ